MITVRDASFIFLACSLLAPVYLEDFIGPADLFLNRMEWCSEPGMGVEAGFKLRIINRTHRVVDGFASMPFALDESVGCRLEVSKWGDGGWKPNAHDINEPNCCAAGMKFVKTQLEKILEMNGKPKECPIRPGNYSKENHIFGADVKLPLPYGKYKMDFVISKEKEDFLCLRAYVNVDPKKALPF